MTKRKKVLVSFLSPCGNTAIEFCDTGSPDVTITIVNKQNQINLSVSLDRQDAYDLGVVLSSLA